MNDTLQALYAVVKERKANPQEGSYTCYLFDKGLDKILKKVGEACSLLLIAGKAQDWEKIAEETGNLLYHLMVLMLCKGIPLEALEEELDRRSGKTGNLKEVHASDHNT